MIINTLEKSLKKLKNNWKNVWRFAPLSVFLYLKMIIKQLNNKVMKNEVLVFNIYWDETDWDETDSEMIEHYESLPKEATILLDEVSEESIEDYLTDEYGWAVSCFDYQLVMKSLK